MNKFKKVLLSIDERGESLLSNTFHNVHDLYRNVEDKVMLFFEMDDMEVLETEMIRKPGQILDKYDVVADLHRFVPTSQRKLNLRHFVDGNARNPFCMDFMSRGLHLRHVRRIIEFQRAANSVTW